MPDLRIQLSAVQALLRGTNLQARFLLIIGMSSLLFALVIWGVFNSVIERVIDRIGIRFAEKQVLYDKARTLQPLIREVALARQMADSVIVKHWAANEYDPQLRASALAEMEKFRQHFQDGSYFLALAGSGHYYFNDASGQYAGRELRYTLNRATPADAWFYATIKSPQDYLINVDPDTKLGVTKVWINVLLRDGSKVLGVIGTGLDLSDFIHNVADINQPGITNLFVDRDGAIQIYHDVQYIDFSSIVKSVDKRRSIDQLLEKREDRDWIRHAIADVAADSNSLPTRLLYIKGKHYLAGVAALPEVGWYDVTLLDLGVLLPQRDFFEMALAVGGAVLWILIVLAFTLHRLVLRPVAELTDAATRISQGNFAPAVMRLGSSEVGQLASQFNSMADSLQKAQDWLEEEVTKRTRELADARRMLEVTLQQEIEWRQAQENLLALMAHEVRSPVAVIGNTAQMLNVLATSEKPEWRPRIEKIMVAVRQLAQLMDDILAEDRIKLKSNGLHRQSGDLNIFCDELRVSQMVLHGRTIRFEPGDSDTTIHADWQLIKVAIANLIDNAIKYSPPDSEIELRVRSGEQNTVFIEVRDEGATISSELQSRIFEKFVRGRTGDGIQGIGIGLYLVNWVVRLHGGHTEVTATEDGNTFRLVLPR
jgi:signal transduction histidine kinase